MTREQRERIAASAASDWCRCFKCDGIINETGTPCDKPSGVTCIKFRDGYKTALIALEKAERWGIVKGDGEIVKDINGTLDEAVAHIHAERENHKGEGPLLPIEGNGENTRWHYDEWDEAHDYGIEQAPILSTFKQEGQR